MKKFALLPLIALVAFSMLALNGCKKDDEDPDDVGNDAEVITSVTLTFTNTANANDVVTASFKDPDGDGGNAPTVFETITLSANTQYNCAVTLADESGTEVEDITAEIEEEAAEHLFCYTVSGGDLTITRTDSDGTFPIGLTSQWDAAAAGTGTVQVVLKHQPDGEKDGTCTPGDTDVDLTFDLVIQ